MAYHPARGPKPPSPYRPPQPPTSTAAALQPWDGLLVIVLTLATLAPVLLIFVFTLLAGVLVSL